MTVTNKVEVEAFLALIDQLRVRGVTSIKCDAFEVTMNPVWVDPVPETLDQSDPEEPVDEELLFYSAR